ncbi:acyl-CoA N-acyltransferase [Jackrogersella minutella]|nr:acyl-CoA N-acyltransferase [Jackrogersella minutella]
MSGSESPPPSWPARNPPLTTATPGKDDDGEGLPSWPARNPPVASSSAAADNGFPSSFSRADMSAAAEDAVDDTEDLPDRDVVQVKGTSSYGRRHRKSHAAADGGGEWDDKMALIHDVVPFPFHPNVRPLTLSDVDSCVALEDAAFEHPEHRCTKEKFEYRLSVCPELCLGLFCTIVPDKAEDFEISTLAPAHPVETGRDDGAKSVLIAHIVATKSDTKVVTDANMEYPRDFRTKKHNDTDVGHQETGRTVCVHSLAVHPKLHGCHLGKLIMMSYLQQLKNSGVADYCALICQDYLIPFYEKFNFSNMGPSQATFGGGGWHDMTLKIADVPPYSGGILRK